MAKHKFAPWGTSPVDHLVAAFLREKGINPDDLQGYTINRSIDDIGTITFSMLFEEESVEPDLPVVQNYLVGESGPELFPPGLLCKCMDSECSNPHYVPPDEESE